MSKDTSYVEYVVHDVLGHISGITAKAMFSGWGIYLDGAIIAIIADGELYFKANKELKEKYKQDGYYPVTYDRKGKGRVSKDGTRHDFAKSEMNYLSVKAEDLENREEISRRVEESYSLSIR